MKALLFWTVVVAAVTAAAWWREPEGLLRFAEVRWREVKPILPALGGLALVGAAAGLYVRERSRFASPALAWLGKRTAVGGAALAAVFVLVPTEWPLAVTYPAGAITACGIAAYLGNLPARL